MLKFLNRDEKNAPFLLSTVIISKLTENIGVTKFELEIYYSATV